MTVAEVARLIGVSRSTLYRWLRRGQLGRFEEAGLTVSKVGRRWRFEEAQTGMIEITVDWRAVAYNAPSRNMPKSVPWVHGLIRNSRGRSPRIQLAPKRPKGDVFPVNLTLLHPDQDAAKAIGWVDVEIVVDGHAITAQNGMEPADEWRCDAYMDGCVWALQARLTDEHPLVTHAAEAAKGPQEGLRRAEDAFYVQAREWVDANFPHPDIMNVVRSLMWAEWNGKEGYWPGDPLPDFDTIMNAARDKLRR